MSLTGDRVEPRVFNTGERAGFDTRFHLANATRQAEERGYKDFLIVDADAHHLNEMTHYREIVKYIDDEVLRNEVLMGERGGLLYPGFRSPQHHSLSGRILRYRNEHLETFDSRGPPRGGGVLAQGDGGDRDRLPGGLPDGPAGARDAPGPVHRD